MTGDVPDQIVDIAAEFSERIRSGEAASVEDYAIRYPELANDLRRYLPVVEIVEFAVHQCGVSTLMARAVTQTDQAAPKLQQHAPTADQLFEMPEQFGRYRIDRLLGQGNMGAVYVAHDIQLDRRVAIKVPRLRGEESDRIERFYREARSMATVEDRNLCPVYDVGEIDGRHFLTMACIDGVSLAEHIKSGGKFTDSEAATTIRKLAAALQVAHDAGIVHRDLKPANIMIDEAGEPIVMDFGLARRTREGESALTHDGAIIGSPAYMAPEQIESGSDGVGPWSDVYALGVILFEILCGRRPFEGPTMATLRDITWTDAPLPSSIRPDIAPELETICLKAMAKSPDDRYQSAAALAKALESYPAESADLDVGTAPHRSVAAHFRSVRWLSPRKLIAGGVIGVVVIGAFVFLKQPETPFHTQESAGTKIADQDGDLVAHRLPPAPVPTTAGTGTFEDSGQRLGASSSSVVQLGDLDGDDDLDAFVGCSGTEPDLVWLNDGTGQFRDSGQRLANSDTLGVSLGDIDGDGDFDAVTTSASSATVIWSNDGDGRFSVRDERLIAASHAALSDVDNDGDLDLFMCTSKFNHVLKNDGMGHFVDSGQRLGQSASRYAALGDIDQDGDPDAYVCNSRDSRDVLYLNDGRGQFTMSSLVLSDTDSTMVRLVDWDGNGHPDALVCARGEPIRLWWNNPAGTFTERMLNDDQKPFLRPSGHCIGAGDFDGDSDIDLFTVATTGFGEPACIVRNEKAGTGSSSKTDTADRRQSEFQDETTPRIGFRTPSSAPATEHLGLMSGAWVDIGDLDGDGDLDVFVAATGDEPDQVWINRNADAPERKPLFVKSDLSFGANDPRWTVAVADFDGDFDPDIFAPGYRNSGAVWIMNEAGEFEDTGQMLDWENASWISAGDLDGDGDIDIFASSHGGSDVVWLNDGDGVFRRSDQKFPTAWSRINTLVDIDQDGDPDAVVAVWDDDDQLWLNDGDAAFSRCIRLPGAVSYGVASGDIDNDGDPDLVFAGPSLTEPLRFWINDGDGNFERLPLNITVPLANAVAFADLDGDKDLDLIVGGDKGTSLTRIYIGDGDGGFTASPTVLPAMSTFAVAHGDLDGDGDIDLITGNIEQPNQILLNDGHGGFEHEQWYSRHHSSPTLIDIDGDGDPDIVDSSGSVWLNRGSP